jgi:hypothetical protein
MANDLQKLMSYKGAGEGTRNLVVFDDSIVKTLKRNGDDLLPEMLKPQSGTGYEQSQKQTDTIPNMLKTVRAINKYSC